MFVLKEKWYPFYILTLIVLIWTAGRGWLPFLLAIGLISLTVYRFFNCRDLERVTSVAIAILGLLLIVGVRSGYISGLFIFTFIIDILL